MKEYVLKIAQRGFAAGMPFLADAEVKTDAGRPCFVDPEVKNTEEARIGASGNEHEGALRKKDKEAELARFRKAADILEQQLRSAAAKANGEGAAIFDAERLLLTDRKFTDAVCDLIVSDGQDAAAAVTQTGRELAEELRGSKSGYIRERSGDLTGLTERLLQLLEGRNVCALSTPAILAADELTPAQISSVDPALILGIITVKGSPTSHVSVLAGNLGIPYCYGSEEAVAAIRAADFDGDVGLILDGRGADKGKLIIQPDRGLYRDAVLTMEEEFEAKRCEKERRKREKETAPATRTRVCANITGPLEIGALIESGAEGVGLFRTELLFLGRADAPTEEEQLEAYRRIAEAMDGKETVIRTMDLGSDKQADWLCLPEEKNPALGCRGLRVSLKEKDVFRTQIRALLQAAAYGNIRIMIPMVTAVREVEAVQSEIEICAKELAEEGRQYRIPPLGVMIETPAAAMIADQLAEKADFFSIGTNDLTQYTLALDRESQGLDDYYDPCHEAVLRLIGITAEAGHRRNIPTAVCGELAADPGAIPLLIERGVDELSVSVSKVAATKACVIEAEARTPVTQPLQAQREAEARLSHTGNEEMLPNALSLAAPADGELIPMEEIPDTAFASGTLGDCVGILPENGMVYAPCDGVVSGIAQTGHAITFTASDGREVLVHAGLDTVTLGGRGFTVLTKAGASVAKGEPVLEMDLAVIRDAGLSPMVITVLMK